MSESPAGFCIQIITYFDYAARGECVNVVHEFTSSEDDLYTKSVFSEAKCAYNSVDREKHVLFATKILQDFH